MTGRIEAQDAVVAVVGDEQRGAVGAERQAAGLDDLAVAGALGRDDVPVIARVRAPGVPRTTRAPFAVPGRGSDT